MHSREVVVKLRNGLHARPASHFVQEANRFSSEIHVIKENKKVNAKSIMGIMSLAINHGATITIEAEGPDEVQAVDTLVTLVEKEE